jgi:hypothetical protein
VIEIGLAIAAGPLLWLAGAVGFDAVHWLLHRMLRSPHGWVRALAWPHGVHHAWIDRELETHLDLQRANVWCHIVPEYLTQLVFTAFLALVLPLPFAVVVFALQTAIFLAILAYRGQDLNHRPAARIDAHRPGWTTPPSYHALHHAWPDAYFSAYTKLVDWIVGGGAWIADRRFGGLASDSRPGADSQPGPGSPLGAALRAEVGRAGGTVQPEPAAFDALDVLVLLDPDAALGPPVERYIEATRGRRLPPEVWALRSGADDPVARHYRDDVRVTFRALLLPDAPLENPVRAARQALWWIRRDAHAVPLAPGLAGLAAALRFTRTQPACPAGASLVRHRLEYLPSPAGIDRQL